MSALRLQLRQCDGIVIATSAHVEQGIPVPAFRADEVTPVVIDLGIRRCKFDIGAALLASPHGSLLRVRAIVSPGLNVLLPPGSANEKGL
jgi:hypothetical protein